MTQRIWNLVYLVGTTGQVITSADNPMSRKEALDGAAVITKNGWPCWVQHEDDGERVIFVNDLERARRAAVTLG